MDDTCKHVGCISLLVPRLMVTVVLHYLVAWHWTIGQCPGRSLRYRVDMQASALGVEIYPLACCHEAGWVKLTLQRDADFLIDLLQTFTFRRRSKCRQSDLHLSWSNTGGLAIQTPI